MWARIASRAVAAGAGLASGCYMYRAADETWAGSMSVPESFLPRHVACAHSSTANAEVVGEFASSGMLFKDSVVVTRVDDPMVKGVTIYLSTVKRPLSDRLMKSFFTEPSATVVEVVQTSSPLVLDERLKTTMEGEDVFNSKKTPLFKSVHVKRIVDEERKVLIYVGYNYSLATANEDKLGTRDGRFKTSICAIPYGLAEKAE